MHGISADERLCGLYEMHVFLNEQVNIDKFPFNHNHYVEGMRIQKFEAILQNISTRIQLYEFARTVTTTHAAYVLYQTKVSFQI